MQFKDAEILLGASILTGYPPLFVVGPNGIGKTELIKTEAQYYNEKFKNIGEVIKFTTGMDYGGLKQFVQYGDKTVKTIALSDIQTILARKSNVMSSTIGYISTLAEEGVSEELTFSKFNRTLDSRKLNFIIGSTPRHTVRLVRFEQIDFLTRFLYLPVDRNITQVDVSKPYPIHELPTTFDDTLLKDWTKLGELDIHVNSARDSKMISHLFLTLLAMGYAAEYANILIKQIKLFREPDDTDKSWQKLYSRVLVPL